jgi:2-dehydropantoate 2-reductase
MNSRFQHTAVVGAGAVGSYFGAMLARAGHHVTLIGRLAHVEAIEKRGLNLDMGGRVELVRMAANTELAAVHDADLVLFCVKSTDTDAVARDLAPHLAPNAIVMSLQNGVENAPTIAKYVRQPVIAASVYVATALPEAGTVKHFGRGDLIIGALQPGAEATLHAIVEFFDSAHVPVSISSNVMVELWSKLMVNCAYNAISALAQTSYGQLSALAEIRSIQHQVVREVVALAKAEGVPMHLDAALQSMERIAVAMPGQLSSTAQDVARRKPSEIDHLNGFVVRRGRELGIATPVNETLHALVKLVEATHGGG